MSYDSTISRLMVRPWDNWRGINPVGPNDVNPPIFAAKFATNENYNHILAIANEDGRVSPKSRQPEIFPLNSFQIFQIALQNTFVKKSINEELSLEGDQCHHNAVFDIAWMPYHLKLISASGDHTARLWDVSTSRLTSIREFCGHSRSIKVATFPQNNCNVFATGGRDGAIIIWDTRSSSETGEVMQKVDNKILNAHIGGPTTPSTTRRRNNRSATPKNAGNMGNSSVTGLVFQDENTLISCGPGDGLIKAWDLRRCYSTLKKEPIAKYNLPYAGSTTFKGFTNLVVDSSGTKLYASCMDSNIYCYNIGTFSKNPVMVYTGAQIKSFYIKSCLSPDDKYLLSGSSDEKAYIWNVNQQNPVASLVGHNYEVTSVAWAHHQNNLDGGNMAIVTCSDDACHKIWRVGPVEVDSDEVTYMRGSAEMNPDYYSSCLEKTHQKAKQQFKMLESTPRSIKRLIQQSETTPTTSVSSPKENIQSSNRKRTYDEMNFDGIDESAEKPDVKRAYNIETRGRRLFSPIEARNSESEAGVEGTSRLTTILEELDSPGSKNFQNLSPSPVKRQLTVIKSPEPVRKFSSPSVRADPLLNSPTTNLPNYVINPRESPHFSNLTSPLRKPKKENVDWLTKIRKQKLLTLSNTMDKTVTQTNSTETDQNEQEKLKSIENKTDGEVKKIQSNKTTLLKFFSVKNSTNKISLENGNV